MLINAQTGLEEIANLAPLANDVYSFSGRLLCWEY